MLPTFYYPVTLSFYGQSMSVNAPFVTSLEDSQSVSSFVVVLSQQVGAYKPGVYVFDGKRWHFAMPYVDLCLCIASNATVNAYLINTGSVVIPNTDVLYVNGQISTNYTLVPNTGVYLVKVPSSGGNVYTAGQGLNLTSGQFSIPTQGSLIAGTYSKLTVNGYGIVTTATSLSAADITTILGYTPYSAANPNAYISGNQSIAITGDASGSGTTAITLTLPVQAGLSAGQYGMLTVNTKGQVTAGVTIADVPHGGTGVATLTGLVKGTGTTAMVAAVAGSDYSAGTAALATGLVKSTTTTGALTTAAASDVTTTLGYKPGYAVCAYAVPFCIPSSGLMGNNGALTLTTALQYIISAWMYFPANAIQTSSAAGWYWTIMSSTTLGTVYNNVYLNGAPTPPASPTAFVTTGPGAYTQSLGAHNAIQYTMPGGTLGSNGQLEWNFSLSNSETTASAKTFAVIIGGTSFYSQTATNTGDYYNAIGGIANRNAQNVNINMATSFAGGTGSTTLNVIVGSVDTSQNQTLAISLQLGNVTDWLTLEAYHFIAFPN